MVLKSLLIITAVLCLAFIGQISGQNYPEGKLIKKLINEDDKFGRPVSYVGNYVKVDTSFTLISIKDIDLKAGLLTTSLWLKLGWTVDAFQWDPAENEDIKAITVPANKIWLPDILPFNDVDLSYKTDLLKTDVVILSSGRVTFVPKLTLTTTCSDIIKYSCKIQFGSWTATQERLNMTLGSVDTTFFTNGTAWNLVEATAASNSVTYACCPEAYQDITLTLKMKPMNSRVSMMNSVGHFESRKLIMTALVLTSFLMTFDTY